jgi:hypothetical protein
MSMPQTAIAGPVDATSNNDSAHMSEPSRMEPSFLFWAVLRAARVCPRAALVADISVIRCPLSRG